MGREKAPEDFNGIIFRRNVLMLKPSELFKMSYEAIMLKAAVQQDRTDENEEFIHGLVVAYVDVAEIIKKTADKLEEFGQ